MEEPLLTLHLQASYRDYKNAWLHLHKKTSTSSVIRWSLFLLIFSAILGVTWLNYFNADKRAVFNLSFCILLSLFCILVIISLLVQIVERVPLLVLVYFWHYRFTISKFFVYDNAKKMKGSIIPYNVTFYSTYLTKSTPNIEDIYRVPYKKRQNLPLTYIGHLDYDCINKYIIDDEYIIIDAGRLFIPVQQLSKQEFLQVKAILAGTQDFLKKYII